jgi:hypothetical protein
VKRTIRGTHIHVSAKHLPKYLGEIEYRFNMRGAASPWALFCAIACMRASKRSLSAIVPPRLSLRNEPSQIAGAARFFKI